MKTIKHKLETYTGTNYAFKKSNLQFLICTLLVITPVHYSTPHGTVTSPPSRVWVCYQENPENPDSPACEAAIIGWGTKAFYDWNEVARMDAYGMHQDIIMDGNLASAGRPDKFGGLDQVRDDWVATAVTPGPFTITWTNTAPHETLYYRVFITKADWKPTQPLTWDSLELLVETAPRPAASIDHIDVVLPQRIGKHVIYSVWQRSLTGEAFYSTSDVDFGSDPGVNVAPEAIFTSENGYCGGSEVSFSAIDTYDANGDELTYFWDFGDGATARGIEVSHTYNGLSSALVTLTVSDGKLSSGTTGIINLLKEPDCNELFVCPLDVPRLAPLPSVNETYKYAYVIGENGPDFSDLYKFFINWDLANKGLYNLDYQTLSTYTSFLNMITHSFDETNPEVTFSGTNIVGLDGSYYATIDNGNLGLVSKTGDFTIYFSTTETTPDCGGAVSNTVRGGTLNSERTYTFVVSDGIADYADGITLEGSIGQYTQWLVADESGIILQLPNSPEEVNFEATGQGRVYIYHLSYNGAIEGLAVGRYAFAIEGEFDYSNSIEITKVNEEDDPLAVDSNEYAGIPTQNYPNPFAETTSISYTLDQKSTVSVHIYNLKGQLVKTYDNATLQAPGKHQLTITLATMNTGIYLYVVEAENKIAIRRMVLKK